MVQEIVTFEFPGSAFPIALHILGFPVGGDVKIATFNYNTSIGPVLDELK